jgi:hypothetical protein
MAEMRTLDCPGCDAPNQPIAVVEGIVEYRCRACGVVYMGPCGCDTVHENGNGRLRADAPSMPEDFAMLLPVLRVENASTVHKYPGCS